MRTTSSCALTALIFAAACGGGSDSRSDAATGDQDAPTSGALPAGWLYTKGNQILVADGAGGGARWMGRGVNTDDLFLCGFNNSLWKTDVEQDVDAVLTAAITQWKANFLRVSLSMASNQ